MNSLDILTIVSIALDDLSEDAEIRDLQIKQIQQIIDLQLCLEEVQIYENVHRRT